MTEAKVEARDVGEQATITVEPAPADSATSEPSPTTFEEALDKQLRRARDLMLRKQHDYGPGNIMNTPLTDILAAWEMTGIDRTMAIEMGIFVRLFDKISRMNEGFQNAGKTAVPGETLEDTWRDIVGYGIIALMVREGQFELPMEFGKGDDLGKNWVHPGDECPSYATDPAVVDFVRHVSSDGEGGQVETPAYEPTAEEQDEADGVKAAPSRPTLVEETNAIREEAAADMRTRIKDAEGKSGSSDGLPPSLRRSAAEVAVGGR